MIICKECGIEVYIRQRGIGIPLEVSPYYCFSCELFLKINEVEFKK